jgi:uncharacterized repeat protein (TIGR03803 family)
MRQVINPLCLTLSMLFLGAATASSASFTNLYIFSADAYPPSSDLATNGDGVSPDGLLLSGNQLFGTANLGGPYGCGAIFRVNTDGSNFTNLFSFNQGTYDSANGTWLNSTGYQPNPGLILVGNSVWGTTFYGGLNDAGIVFRFDYESGNFTLLHQFDFTDGQSPASGLTHYNNALYGTTTGGGTNGYGVIYEYNLGDSAFSVIYQFQSQINPYGGLAISNNILYGFGEYGGPSLDGLVYSYNLTNGVYTELFDFSGVNGANPYSTPILSGDALFGVTYDGGTNGAGNVFRLNINGSEYTNLYDFTAQSGANTNGAEPYGLSGLVLSGNKLFGTTSVSGSGGQGTVFELNTDGTGFHVLHSFDYTDGANPGPLVFSNSTLYGATQGGIRGVSSGDGAVFALTLAPTLNIQLVGGSVVLTWNDSSYSLYSATVVNGAYTNISGATSPWTNVISTSAQFFELK